MRIEAAGGPDGAPFCGNDVDYLRNWCRDIYSEILWWHVTVNDTDNVRIPESEEAPLSSSFLIELADYFYVSLDYLILGRGGRTDELKEELNRIREQVEHIMRLLWDWEITAMQKGTGRIQQLFRFLLFSADILFQISGCFNQTGVRIRSLLTDIGKLFVLVALKAFWQVAFRLLYFF